MLEFRALYSNVNRKTKKIKMTKTTKAKFRRRISHEPNRMLMR